MDAHERNAWYLQGEAGLLTEIHMKVMCHGCTTKWDVETVLWTNPKGFDRDGCVIGKCPTCTNTPPNLDSPTTAYLVYAACYASEFGDDLFAYARWLAGDEMPW